MSHKLLVYVEPGMYDEPGTGARINGRIRPWPANPRKYPLSGPSRGPVYAPPHWFNLRTFVIDSTLGAMFASGVLALGMGCAHLLMRWLAK